MSFDGMLMDKCQLFDKCTSVEGRKKLRCKYYVKHSKFVELRFSIFSDFTFIMSQ